jgi:MFS family permease
VAKRGRVLALFYMAIPVGSALGFVLGGAVSHSSIGALGADWFGIQAESWRWAFYLVVVPGLVLGASSFWMKEPPRGQADQAPAHRARSTTWQDYVVLVKTPSYVLCTLGMTAMTFAMGGIAFWMPYFLKHQPGSSGPVEVIFGGITCLAGLLGTLLGGLLGDRLRSRFSGSYFLVSGLAMLLGFPFMLLSIRAPFPTIWILIFVTCFCLFFNTGPTNTILANVTHPSLRSTAFALNILVIHSLGDVISPVIIGIVSDRYSMVHAFSLVGAMFVVAGILWLSGIRFLKRDTELAPTRLATL